MHILLGLILFVVALVFAPWAVGIAVGLMASYWAFGLIIFVAVACWVLAPQVIRVMRRQAFATGGYCGDPGYKPGEILGRVGPAVPASAPVAPAKPVAKSEVSPVVRLSPCGACGEQIKKGSMYCPSCGGDPRAKH